MAGLGNVLGHSLDTFSTTQFHPQGHVVCPDNDGRFYAYHKFKETVIKGSPVSLKYSASDLVVTNVFATGVRGAGVTIGSGGAAGSYGWIQISGKGKVNLRVTGTVSARTKLYFSETGKAMAPAITTTTANCFIEAIAAKSGTNVVAGKYWIYNCL